MAMLIKELGADHSRLCQIARLSGRESLSSVTMRHLELASQHQHFELIRNSEQDVVGYVAWCKCSKENILLVNKFKANFQSPRYDYEYNAGRFMYVLDVAFDDQSFGRSRALSMATFRAFIRKHRYVFAYRDGLVLYTLRKGRVIKIRPSFHLQGYEY